MGRPGHGAPLRTPSGRNKASVHCDPSIRFQFTEQSRRSVDNELRYRSTIEEKENYRKQLGKNVLPFPITTATLSTQRTQNDFAEFFTL